MNKQREIHTCSSRCCCGGASCRAAHNLAAMTTEGGNGWDRAVRNDRAHRRLHHPVGQLLLLRLCALNLLVAKETLGRLGNLACGSGEAPARQAADRLAAHRRGSRWLGRVQHPE
eukprot:scaffold78141_cov32-Tisochrysis_lutea.AAC.1